MRIAVLTTTLVGRAGNGGELCSARLVAGLLRAGHHLHVIGRGPVPGTVEQDGTAASLSWCSLGPREEAFASQPLHRRAAALLGAWWTGRASTVHRLAGPGTAQRVAAELRGGSFDAIVVDHLHPFAWLADADAAARLPLLLLMHNLEAQGYEDAARHGGPAVAIYRREARLLRALEARALRRAVAVACLSEGDAAALRAQAAAEGSAASVVVLPGYPMGPERTAERLPAPPGQARRIGLLGTWTWRPNREALDWMLQQVLPRLPASCELVLAGRGLAPSLAGPRVKLMGWIADVRQFYDAVDVVAVPSWCGSGVHEKAIEAVARAPLVVATPHALRGLGGDLPTHVHVASDAAEFARLCVLAGPGAGAAAGARAWARQRQAAYAQALATCLRTLGDEGEGACVHATPLGATDHARVT